ncbi:ABC transporter permease [Variovorax sp. PCZ-1]|uniref:ABC transporter permease n=1 Tax=Variovorax sp. PCZ-1 TaxID=2835533 RepID=UPI001BD04C93|nr:ABC transporter permease [Variovorax sp. PCZ-1]MBS7807218.1 ABC transporter permease [Variovorax sp. PCZ-1]
MRQLWLTALTRLLAQAGFVAAAMGVLSFFLTRALPGDAAFRIAAARYGYDMVNADAAQAVRLELGLDKPAWQQLIGWLGDLLQLRLGNSLVTGEPVWGEIVHQLGATVHLSLVAWVLGVLLGVILGTLAALRGGWLARLIDTLCVVLRASPAFLIGVVLMLYIAVRLQWLPVAGHDEEGSIILPALTLALALCAGIAQVVQLKLRQVLQSDAFEYAQIKGLPLAAALWRHAAPAVALPTLAYAGVQLVLLMEGVVVVESLFAWPGIGHAMVHAVIARDVPMIQGTALVTALLFVLLNTVVDTAAKLLDPRQRHAQALGAHA